MDGQMRGRTTACIMTKYDPSAV